MSKKAVLIGTAVLVIIAAGGAAAGFVLLRDTPAVQAVTDAVGIEPNGKTYTGADASAALLVLADLPGYSVNPDDGDTDDGVHPCGATFDPGKTLDAGGGALNVSKGFLGPYLFHTTGLLAGSDLDVFRKAFGGCSAWTEPNGDKYTLTDANFGAYGDETYSVKIAVSTPTMMAGGGIVMIRKGNLASVLFMLGLPDVGGDDMMAMAAKAAGRLPK